jgi:CRISPR-associated protein Csh2
METINEKSEILFFYESKYSIPNGDPFTGEQRYDDETKHILVSDVRIKRFIRDHLHNIGEAIYVINDKEQIEGNESGSSARVKSLRTNRFKELIEKAEKDAKDSKDKNFNANLFLLRQCVDVRLFGGISTEKKENVNITGPVQFALLNPSLNTVDLRMHQNTSVFSSDVTKSGGAIGTTTVVPYSIIQIHGWVNPASAKLSSMTNEDLQLMFKALWQSVNNANTRTKSNQSSLLLIQIIYNNINDKAYGIDEIVKIKSDKRDEQLRCIEDFKFDFEGLKSIANSSKVKEIKYYTELGKIEAELNGLGGKLTKLTL